MPKRLKYVVYSVLLVLSVYMYYLSGQMPAQQTVPQQQQQSIRADPLRPTASLGVSRTSLTDVFGRAPFNLAFDFVPLADGRARFVGRSTDGQTTLELIGPPEGLTAANLMAALPEQSPLVRLRNVNAVSVLVERLLPNWADAPNWVGRNIDAAFSGRGASTQANGKIVTMSRAPRTETLMVTIAGPPL